MSINPREQVALLRSLAEWTFLGAAAGVLSGLASAAFLIALEWATNTREADPRLIWLLPFGGAAIGWVYNKVGRQSEGGTPLLFERIHTREGAISWLMAPLVAFGTIGTHLFGGSAGREGTALQMGGSLAESLGRVIGLREEDRRLLLMGGISGGFGSVFGTPVAGAFFGLEVLTVGRIRYDGLIPCVVGSIVGDMTCRSLGVGHHQYNAGPTPAFTPLFMLWVALAGVAFGLASLAFAELTHAIQNAFRFAIRVNWMRPFVGGLFVLGMTELVGNRDHLGLSLPLIDRSFTPGGVSLWAFALKLLFTSITLGAGFKGGEVTPLFAIGATLGSTFAWVTGQPTATFAALGFVAVLAGAANTPLTCAVLGMELFGSGLAAPLMLACVVSYITSGHRGIYPSQRIDTPKSSAITMRADLPVSDAHHGAVQVGPAGVVPLGRWSPAPNPDFGAIPAIPPLDSTESA
ncbi:chloride channel protein [Isosphaeraceae bacterium EP7]